MGLCQYVTFAFTHHPYLVCILFGMLSLHLFTLLMFFIYLFIEKWPWYAEFNDIHRNKLENLWPLPLSC